MRIVALSDTHTQHRNVDVPEGDVLIFAGDGEFRSALDLIDFNDWLAHFKFDHIIVIAGLIFRAFCNGNVTGFELIESCDQTIN